ncbi:proline-rich protein 36 [Salarias fasciatus]|uniref:proline-rich protein 36 n=1 Tax=Salarias fasciatus TaxID=181472 RepID=UPI001176CBAE|nr:proline-rich protein 36-like [Salarias fasciatus]
MSPLFMCESDSPGSLSAEDRHSNNAGSEREGEGQQTGPRGLKRREKNRNAARKSRKKQTERADELHEELQSLERSNSALQREIATLTKELHVYEAALKRHEPHCRLKTSPPSSLTHPSFSDPNRGQSSAASPGIPLQSPSSLPASETSSLGSKRLNYTEKTHHPLAVPLPVTPPSAGPPSKLYSVQLSAHADRRSSFEVKLPIASTPSSFLTPVPSPVPQPQSGQHTAAKTSSDYFTAEPFVPKQDSSNAAPPCSLSGIQTSGTTYECYPVNLPQLHPFQSIGNPSSSRLLSSLYDSPLQNPAPRSFPALPRSGPEPRPVPAFDLKLRHIHQVAPNPAPLLTQLTVPRPLGVPPSTSCSFGQSLAPPLQSLPPPGHASKDLSLSEFLDDNDWILTGTNSHNSQ